MMDNLLKKDCKKVTVPGLTERKIINYITGGGISRNKAKRKYLNDIKKIKSEKFIINFGKINDQNLYSYKFDGIDRGCISFDDTDLIQPRHIHSTCDCSRFGKSKFVEGLLICKHIAKFLYLLKDDSKVDYTMDPLWGVTELNEGKFKINDLIIDKKYVHFDGEFNLCKLFTIKVHEILAWLHGSSVVYILILLLGALNIINTFSPTCCSSMKFDDRALKWKCEFNNHDSIDILCGSVFEQYKVNYLPKVFRYMWYYMNDMKASCNKLCQNSGINKDYAKNIDTLMRRVAGLARKHLTNLLGCNGSTLEMDAKYFKDKTKKGKQIKSKITWFKGFNVFRMLERDLNMYGRHNMFTLIIKAESKHSLLQPLSKYCQIGSKMFSDGCGIIRSQELLKIFSTVKNSNHKKLQWVTPETLFLDVDNKVHNNNVENLWKFLTRLNNDKFGFISITNFVGLLWIIDWDHWFTDGSTNHRIIRMLEHIAWFYPSKLPTNASK
mmetsp:Transcript_10682/g.13290  ORF Transcript_10682/g.13290 Transcript_10682/m.13290 type:complete len:495 (-) Transcript_10682:81-1565(-)